MPIEIGIADEEQEIRLIDRDNSVSDSDRVSSLVARLLVKAEYGRITEVVALVACLLAEWGEDDVARLSMGLISPETNRKIAESWERLVSAAGDHSAAWNEANSELSAQIDEAKARQDAGPGDEPKGGE